MLGAQYFVYMFETQCVVLVVTRDGNYYVLLLKVGNAVLYDCGKMLLCIIIVVRSGFIFADLQLSRDRF